MIKGQNIKVKRRCSVPDLFYLWFYSSLHGSKIMFFMPQKPNESHFGQFLLFLKFSSIFQTLTILKLHKIHPIVQEIGLRFKKNKKQNFSSVLDKDIWMSFSSQFPEMENISREQKRTSSKIIFFLIQNAGLLTGFTIILMITMFTGQINLG